MMRNEKRDRGNRACVRGRKIRNGWVGDQFRLTYQSIQVHSWSGGQSQQRLHPHSTCPQNTKQWQFFLALGFNLFFISQEESLEIDWNCYFILPLSSILIWAWFFSFLSWDLVLSITVLGSDSFTTVLGVSPSPLTIQGAFTAILEWLHFHLDVCISFSLWSSFSPLYSSKFYWWNWLLPQGPHPC